MRESAARIAQLVAVESRIVAKRKAYVEQMTNYLNERIRELNKVKSELAEELRWIDASEARIQELAEREKLVKMQDVLACLNTQKTLVSGENKQKENVIRQLTTESQSLISKIKGLQSDMQSASVGPASIGPASIGPGGATGAASGAAGSSGH